MVNIRNIKIYCMIAMCWGESWFLTKTHVIFDHIVQDSIVSYCILLFFDISFICIYLDWLKMLFIFPMNNLLLAESIKEICFIFLGLLGSATNPNIQFPITSLVYHDMFLSIYIYTNNRKIYKHIQCIIIYIYVYCILYISYIYIYHINIYIYHIYHLYI